MNNFEKLICISLMCNSAAAAAEPTMSYKGKQVRFVINYEAGGPTDVVGRIIGKYLGRYIHGSPTVIIQNMGGAGGLIGANYVGEVAQPDGLTISYVTGIGTKAGLGEPGLRVDPRKFAFVGSEAGVTVTYARTDIPPGLRDPMDILKAKNFWAGGLTPDTGQDLRMRMQLELLKIPFRYVTGYAGVAAARLALQRNEIQMYVESMPSYRAAVEPNLVATNNVIPLWFDPVDIDGKMVRSRDADGIGALPFDAFVTKVNGVTPTGTLWDAYRALNYLATDYLRLFLMPPGTPPDAVLMMQDALKQVESDKDFMDDCLQLIKYVPHFATDGSNTKQFYDKVDPGPDVRAFLQNYVHTGIELAGKR